MPSKYVHSVRHLTPTQLWGRASIMARRKTLHRSQRYLARFQNGSNEGKPFMLLPFKPETHHADQVAALAAGEFTFLNRDVALKQNTSNQNDGQIIWFPDGVTQLWTYNLHYFDYAAGLAQAYTQSKNSDAYSVFRTLVNSWIDSCPPPLKIAWDPYPISLRVSNWIKAYTHFGLALEQDPEFAARLRNSLYAQTKFLSEHLEYHVMGNHFIENGRTLLIAGLFFQDEAAVGWREKGLQILWGELDKQFLADGANYERSPMYHQIMLALYAEAVDLLSDYQARTQEQVATPAQLGTGRERVGAMRKWLAAMLHPDQKIALYNDSAFGIAPQPRVQLAMGQPNSELANLDSLTEDGFDPWPESGYFAFRDKAQKNLLLADFGPLGPSDQPGHAHCDALSYELSIGGERMIVDSGVGNYYGELDWRLYYRSTRAHNTVVVDDAEQSEIWSRFRVAQRAEVVDVRWQTETHKDGEKLAYVVGSHSGYRRLPGQVEHRRWITWVDQRFWIVCDRLTGQGDHVAESLIHLHPDILTLQLPKVAEDSQSIEPGLCQRGESYLQVVPWGVSSIATYFGEREPIQGWYAPEFGKEIKNQVLGLEKRGPLPIWFGYLLWPHKESVSVNFSSENEQSCQIEVTSDNRRYKIYCNTSDVGIKTEKI